MFNLKQKKKEDLKNDSENKENLSRQQEIEQEEKMRVVAKEKAEKELKEAKKKKDMKNGGIGCAVLIGIIVLISIFSSGGEKTPPVSWEEKDNSSMAYIMGEDFVKRNLKSPSTAKFPGVLSRDGHVLKGDDNQYVINSYVDSQNSFGATIRTNFILIIQQVSEKDWRLIDIQFLEN